MTEFSITTRLTTKEYIRTLYIGLYKHPAYILAMILGLHYAITVALSYFEIIDWYAETPIFEIITGAFLLLFPTLIVILSVNQFKSNPSFQNDITYTFREDGVACKGLTFSSEFVWDHIIKQKEIGRFLVLYINKKFGHFIDKKKLTKEQLNYIKLKIKKK